ATASYRFSGSNETRRQADENGRLLLRSGAVPGERAVDGGDLLPLLQVPPLAWPRRGVHGGRPRRVPAHGGARPQVARGFSRGDARLLRRVRLERAVRRESFVQD